MKKIRQRGSSLVEFVIVAPVLAGLGLGTVQAGLVYHGKTILNYATFEAARAGAVEHALTEPMLQELGIRLAPLQGGDGGAERATEAILASRFSTEVLNFEHTYIEVLNPTSEVFEQFKVRSRESGIDVIPNSHLRHQSTDVDAATGVSLQDANVLKIRVTHGFDLQVPLISQLVAAVMTRVDQRHRHFYEFGKIPIRSVATVRMQSEVHGDSLRSASAPPASERPELENAALVDDEVVAGDQGEEIDAPEDTLAEGNGDSPGQIDLEDNVVSDNSGTCNGGFGSDPFLPVTDTQSCGIQTIEPTSSPISVAEGGFSQSC